MEIRKKLAALAAAAALTLSAAAALPGSILVNAPQTAYAAAEIADDSNAYAEETARLVNEERAAYGLAPLKVSPELSAAAEVRANEIVRQFSHTRPDGSSCFTAIGEQGVRYTYAAENIAYGQRTPKAVMNAWMNSSGHRANILSSRAEYIGIGVVNVNGTYYWTQFFASGSGLDEIIPATDTEEPEEQPLPNDEDSKQDEQKEEAEEPENEPAQPEEEQVQVPEVKPAEKHTEPKNEPGCVKDIGSLIKLFLPQCKGNECQLPELPAVLGSLTESRQPQVCDKEAACSEEIACKEESSCKPEAECRSTDAALPCEDDCKKEDTKDCAADTVCKAVLQDCPADTACAAKSTEQKFVKAAEEAVKCRGTKCSDYVNRAFEILRFCGIFGCK